MFTHVKSTIRRVTPEDINGRDLLRVVYVVLEPQYQSTLTEAAKRINKDNPHLAIELSGYLIEELRNEENYANFQRDVSEANIFIASLIFIEDLAQKVAKLRWQFEKNGGIISHVSGDFNPADLGFHK